MLERGAFYESLSLGSHDDDPDRVPEKLVESKLGVRLRRLQRSSDRTSRRLGEQVRLLSRLLRNSVDAAIEVLTGRSVNKGSVSPRCIWRNAGDFTGAWTDAGTLYADVMMQHDEETTV